MITWRRINAWERCLFWMSTVVFAVGAAASVAWADGWVIVPLTRPLASQTQANQFNAFSLQVAGTASDDGGKTTYAVRWDLLPLLSGGQPFSLALSGGNGSGLTLNGADLVGGAVESRAPVQRGGVVWDVAFGGTVPPPPLGGIISPFSRILKLTDTDRFLYHTSQTMPLDVSGAAVFGSGTLSGIGVVENSRLKIPRFFTGDAVSLPVVWDVAGSTLVGGIYGRGTADVVPFRAELSDSGATLLPLRLPDGFPSGTNGLILYGDESGDGAGFLQKPGGAAEAARFHRDGTSAAFGVPNGYDFARLVGQAGDLLIANAGKTGVATMEPFYRTEAPTSSWTPLRTLLGPNSGWERLRVQAVNALGITGAGDFRGQTTGFVILSQAVLNHDGQLFPSPSVVVGAETIELTFKFPNPVSNPRKLAKITIANPAALAFDTAPAGHTVVDNGKGVLIPLQEGQTQVSLRLRTTPSARGDRTVRITARASEGILTSLSTAFSATEVIVRRP